MPILVQRAFEAVGYRWSIDNQRFIEIKFCDYLERPYLAEFRCPAAVTQLHLKNSTRIELWFTTAFRVHKLVRIHLWNPKFPSSWPCIISIFSRSVPSSFRLPTIRQSFSSKSTDTPDPVSSVWKAKMSSSYPVTRSSDRSSFLVTWTSWSGIPAMLSRWTAWKKADLLYVSFS